MIALRKEMFKMKKICAVAWLLMSLYLCMTEEVFYDETGVGSVVLVDGAVEGRTYKYWPAVVTAIKGTMYDVKYFNKGAFIDHVYRRELVPFGNTIYQKLTHTSAADGRKGGKGVVPDSNFKQAMHEAKGLWGATLAPTAVPSSEIL